MTFDMDVNAVSIQNGASVSTKRLGTWKAGLNSNLTVEDEFEMKNLTAAVVYRVYTVVVGFTILKYVKKFLVMLLHIDCSKLHS